VAVAPVHDGPLEEFPGLDGGIEVLGAHEPVVDAVDLSRPRGPGRSGDREPDVGVTRAQVCRDGPFADGCGTSEHGQPSGAGAQPNLSINAACWRGPRPRTRRVSEIPMSAMIARAFTLPTPGSDSR